MLFRSILKTKLILNPLKPNLTQISKSKTIQPSAFEDVDSVGADEGRARKEQAVVDGAAHNKFSY